ncbi:GNAT family N-acetyltransferase [Shouchella sp. JSM 1781072]|uniref:GNAT family N-acetyltransferase n=1 Tax=Bacillaceae TaxID=186817 RepID=UPI000C074D63|nr:GNAT family N-acetyltransferase [Bacillus sp. Marseille-P3800]
MFEGMADTVILSCLQEHMGDAWVNNQESPTAAQVKVGMFSYFAGDANAKEAETLLHHLPEDALVIVHTDEWKKRIETIYKGKFNKFERYRFKQDDALLDVAYLKGFLTNLPGGYELKRIDSAIANKPSLQAISEYFICNFNSIDDFLDRGIGYAILHDGKVVCGATSFSIYNEGIEVEVGTHEDHRKKGLATIASAALLVDCLEHGKYPSWDAANAESVKLAKRLGYVYEEPYETYSINNR